MGHLEAGIAIGTSIGFVAKDTINSDLLSGMDPSRVALGLIGFGIWGTLTAAILYHELRGEPEPRMPKMERPGDSPKPSSENTGRE